MGDEISAEYRAEIAASLIPLAPPKQTKEVVKDVQVLVGDNSLIEKKISSALLTYAKEQTVQVTLPGNSDNSLVTEKGELGNGRFLCPRSHQSYLLDIFTHTVSDVKSLQIDDCDGGSVELESWRVAIEEAMTDYVRISFPKGAVSVFAPGNGKSEIAIYVESSFQKTHMSGRWRSHWVIPIQGKIQGASLAVSGVAMLQTHIYEEGNVQLLSKKSFEFELTANSQESFARDLCAKICESDASYQEAMGNSLDQMSSTSVKALRRQLPMTHSKLDWNKIAAYQIGNELSRTT